MAHLGPERVLDLARQRFFWSRMQVDIEYFIHNVCTWVEQNHPTFHRRALLQPIITTSPFKMICINFFHIECSKGGYEYILVIVDHFMISRFNAERRLPSQNLTIKKANLYQNGKEGI